MPVIEISLLEGHSKEKKKKMIETVSKVVAESLDIPLEWVQVVIRETSKEEWGKGGKPISEL